MILLSSLMARRTGLTRLLVVLATMLTPLLGGAIIYYSLRRSHPKTADFANRMSVAGFAAWITIGYTSWARSDGRVLLAVLGGIGAVATDLAIRVTRSTQTESEGNAAMPSNGRL